MKEVSTSEGCDPFGDVKTRARDLRKQRISPSRDFNPLTRPHTLYQSTDSLETRSSFSFEQIKEVNRINSCLVQTVLGRGKNRIPSMPSLFDYAYNNFLDSWNSNSRKIDLQEILNQYLYTFFDNLFNQSTESIYALSAIEAYVQLNGFTTIYNDISEALLSSEFDNDRYLHRLIRKKYNITEFQKIFTITISKKGITTCPFKSSSKEITYNYLRAVRKFRKDFPYSASYFTNISIPAEITAILSRKIKIHIKLLNKKKEA